MNPASDNGATGKRWPQLANRAAHLGLTGETHLSERPGHIIDLAERAVQGGAELVVAVGGDGTLNEAVNGILRAGGGATVATLPIGTGLDFIRTYGIPTSFDDAVRVALDGETRTIDSGRVTFRTWGGDEDVRFFDNVSSAGMSGAVAQRANGTSKALGGKSAYFYSLVRVFFAWENTEVTVKLDGGVEHGRMHDVIVATGRWHGGGMKLAPDASQDDGLFDVILIGDVNKADFIRTAPKLYNGKYLSHPKVSLHRSRAVDVDAPEPLPIELDGEQVGTTPARWEVVPRGLRVKVPTL